MTIADQIRQVSENIQQYCIAAGRPEDSVRLLAVSKTHPVEAIKEAYHSGLREFGESYVQEALEKISHCELDDIVWHFIGPLQSNKTRAVAENFDWVQSVDRTKILQRLSDRRPSGKPPLQICIQANLFDEPQKKGALPDQLPQLLDLAEELPNITLRGLMVIPPRQEDYRPQLEQCARVAELFKQFQRRHPDMDTLSMGMSADLRAAIDSGSNLVRIGTALFGPRGHNHK